MNKIELDRIIATFERYDYVIKATFQKSNLQDEMLLKFEAMMNYFNM